MDVDKQLGYRENKRKIFWPPRFFRWFFCTRRQHSPSRISTGYSSWYSITFRIEVFVQDDVEILLGSGGYSLSLRLFLRRSSSCVDFSVRGKERFILLIRVYWSNTESNTLEHRLAADHATERKLHNRIDEFLFHKNICACLKRNYASNRHVAEMCDSSGVGT